MQTDELVEKRIRLRDKIKTLKDKHKKELEPYVAAETLMDQEFLKRLNQAGLESMNTKYGTVYKTTKTRASVADPTIFFDFVEAGKHWTLLERRLNNAAVQEYIDSTGQTPPGLNTVSIIDVNVRRS